jgi:hypothetical protein
MTSITPEGPRSPSPARRGVDRQGRAGRDWRRRENRREAFLHFYWFHLRHRAHPGAVYYALPAIAADHGAFDVGAPRSTLAWIAYVNAHTQNPVTTALILEAFPDPTDLGGLDRWFAANVERLAWDTDRRHQRRAFPDAVRRDVAVATDWSRWEELADRGWAPLWDAMTSLATFGRLSAWSGIEFYGILGLAAEADDLMLADRYGSRSHRNGLAIVSGRNDLDWHPSNPAFDGRYSIEELAELAHYGEELLAEARARAPEGVPLRDVRRLTLESALCTYKSWHRPNRRYPNVYNDLLADRIRRAEARWPEADLGLLWEARRRALPVELRLEDNPGDPGATSVKQNWYRRTGEIPMLAVDWPDLFPCSAEWAP